MVHGDGVRRWNSTKLEDPETQPRHRQFQYKQLPKLIYKPHNINLAIGNSNIQMISIWKLYLVLF